MTRSSQNPALRARWIAKLIATGRDRGSAAPEENGCSPYPILRVRSIREYLESGTVRLCYAFSIPFAGELTFRCCDEGVAGLAGANEGQWKGELPRPIKKQVRLVVHLAGKRDYQYFREFPTEFFQLLVQNLNRSTLGIVPLGFHVNRRGNMLIAFPDHIPRPTLMANLGVIRNTLKVSDDVRITFDTPRSTIHLTNVPARLGPDSPVFSEAELVESLLNNPAILSLDITSQPHWLCKPENITGARSSVVLSFEDPDGAIARSLLKTPIYAFGAPVTVKTWLAKPANSTRSCFHNPRPSTFDAAME
ncbi:hypothetical protein B0J17DRAFT_628636 [Rhizoctonia solani]|nr:hypothetical protein B0J17DRAFT_628636 [Rhizoctonia solani]